MGLAREGDGEKYGVKKPRILEAEVRGVGYGGESIDKEWVVVRGGTRKGSQRGVGEVRVPVDIEDGSVQLSQNEIGLPICPGEETIEERELELILVGEHYQKIDIRQICHLFYWINDLLLQ
jgi:hypothetical protein